MRNLTKIIVMVLLCNFLKAHNQFESDLYKSDTLNFFITSAGQLCVNDSLFIHQWGLYNGTYWNTGIDIKACNAFQLSTGHNTVVALVSTRGIDLFHPDYVNNIHPLSYQFQPFPYPPSMEDPGFTPDAGIICAEQNNYIGISGVAPNSSLISIKISDSFSGIADGINKAWKNGADIIFIPESNSGYNIGLNIIETAIDSATTFGRGGKGCVIISAIGGCNRPETFFPARLPNVLSVGAMSPCGERKRSCLYNTQLLVPCALPDPLDTSCDSDHSWGSNYGSGLDVIAPGVHIYTTTYEFEYPPTDNNKKRIYYKEYGGTRLAASFAAGVASLILSVNPELTHQQVRTIIESTAQKVRPDLYNYTETSGRPNGTFNLNTGYGLIDAYAAVQAAKCFTNLPIVQGDITQNTTWNSDVHALGTIVVKNQSVLTINSVVKCQDDLIFQIEAESKIILNGTLANACNSSPSHRNAVEIASGLIIIGNGAVLNNIDLIVSNNSTLSILANCTLYLAGSSRILIEGGNLITGDNVTINGEQGPDFFQFI